MFRCVFPSAAITSNMQSNKAQYNSSHCHKQKISFALVIHRLLSFEAQLKAASAAADTTSHTHQSVLFSIFLMLSSLLLAESYVHELRVPAISE